MIPYSAFVNDTIPAGDLAFSSLDGISFSGDTSALSNLGMGDSYKLTQVVTIETGGPAQAISAPFCQSQNQGVLLLLGSGLMGLAALGRNRFFIKL